MILCQFGILLAHLSTLCHNAIMKATSKEILESISKHCHNELTHYRFNTSTLKVSDKYREGRIAALKYIAELSCYYLQEEKKIQEHFNTQVRKQLDQNSCLDDNEYKRGLFDALEYIVKTW